MGSSSKKLDEPGFGLVLVAGGTELLAFLCCGMAGVGWNGRPELLGNPGADGLNGDCSCLSDILLLRGGGGTGFVACDIGTAAGRFLGLLSCIGKSLGD